MITKKELKRLGYKTIEELYDYIIESKINGQFEQVRKIVSNLSHVQHMAFLKWLRDEGHEISNIFLSD
ncbi:MAG: hypothetical protein WCE94_03185 [Candidatus Methanoperedens sp.]